MKAERIEITPERAKHAARLLDAWAEAIRGDWSGIDGRSCRSQLWEITAYLNGAKEELTHEAINVCGKCHRWSHWGGETCDG